MDVMPVRRAIVSVTEKSGLVDLARFLVDRGVELVSTGGTRRLLVGEGLMVRSVREVTGFPEILGGRVKTLHPAVHAGILADKADASHMAILKDLGFAPFDVVCVNLYDFAQAVAQNLDDRQAVEQIDIGGPTMLRAAAKNFHSVCVLPHPRFYGEFMAEVQEQGGVSLEFRRRMAVETFAATAAYDTMITEYLRRSEGRRPSQPRLSEI
jgi:phosphoribosylaminoimidazolecarboxamide formyltransferase/IMP cyclohydrolase